jgi:hypothetical protein
MQRRFVELMVIMCTTDTLVLIADVPRQIEVCIFCEEYDLQNILSFTVKKV